MKKRFFLSLILLSVLFTSCWKEEVYVSGITIDNSSLTLIVGNTFVLKAYVTPSNAYNTAVIWTSENGTIATVSEGTVTAMSPGQTTIRAKSDDGGFIASCTVTVVAAIVPVSGVSLSAESAVLQKGESLTLKQTVSPESATDPSVRWASTDDSVVSVDEQGVVSAIAPGVADVFVTTVDGGFTACCKVVVEQHAKSITLSDSELTIHVLESKILSATIEPEDAIDVLTWESSDPLVASVEYGIVRGLRASPDPVTITARIGDTSVSASCQVKVICDVKGVALKDHNLIMTVGEKDYELEYTVYPQQATNQKVSWLSDNAEVVSVDEGKLTALKKGTAKVTVTTEDGNFKDSCDIEVVNNISGMSLEPGTLSLVEEETAELTVVFNPKDISDEKVTWSSSDESVVTVNDSGKVSALGPGEAVVCATTDTGLHAYCRISVRKMVNSMSFEPNTMVLYLARYQANVSQNRVFKPIIDPEGANVKLLWGSNNESVATVNSEGEVTPVTPGNAVITAYTPHANPDKRVSTSGTVTVIQEVTSITIEPESVDMWEGETKSVAVSFNPPSANMNYRVNSSELQAAGVSFDKQTGSLTASTPGKASLTISPVFAYPQGLEKTCEINVKAHVHGLKAAGETDFTEPVNKSFSLKDKVLFEPAEAFNKNLSWISSDATIATVDENGVVTGKKAGSATITAVADDKYKNAKLEFKVKICETEVKSISMENLTLTEEETKPVVFSIDPADVYDPTLVWESKNNFVATVDQNGNVTGVKAGITTIVATSKATPTVSANCVVTVSSKVVHVTSVTLSKSNLSLSVGAQATLNAQVLPKGADNQDLEWSAGTTDVISIQPGTKSCSITALKEGEATVTVTSKDNGLSASCTVTVTKPVIHVSSVSLDVQEVTLEFGNYQILTATVLPADASDKTVTWSSDDESIAVVSEGGEVVAQSKAGTTTIRVSSNDNPQLAASCVVHVVNKIVHVTGLSLYTDNNETSLKMSMGQVRRVYAKVTPDNATDKSVVWSVQQGGVIFVDSEGNVTANKIGLSRVFADTNDGGFSASMQVFVVENKPAAINLPYDSLVIKVGDTFDLTAEVVGQDKTIPPTNADVQWWPDDLGIVSVVGGHIKALKNGETYVNVKCLADETIQAKCKVTVIGDTTPGGNEGVGYDDWNF